MSAPNQLRHDPASAVPVARPLRILHVVPSYLPAVRYGGPIHSVHGLCKALVSLGHRVEVFTTNVDGDGVSDVPVGQPVLLDGVSVTYFNSSWPRRLFHSKALRKALENRVEDFDIVHLHSVFLLPTLYAARAARRAGVPYVLAPRGMLSDELIRRKNRWIKTAWIRLFEKKTIECAAGLHLTAALEGKQLSNSWFNVPPLFFVPNGIDFDAIPSDLELSKWDTQRKDYVLFLSRINWKKGIERLLKAWKLVPGVNLVIAGNDEESYLPELKRIARAEGIAHRVEFIGPVAGKQKWALLKHAALFVLPSYSENFGIAVLEAMASGCPVVVTPEVGLSSVVSREACGRVVDGDPEQLGHSIAALLKDRTTREEMGKKGRLAAISQFGWDVIGREMLGVYGKIVHSEQPFERSGAA